METKHFIGYYKNFDIFNATGIPHLDSIMTYCVKEIHYTECTNKIEETTCRECLKEYIKSCKESTKIMEEDINKNNIDIIKAGNRLREISNGR